MTIISEKIILKERNYSSKNTENRALPACMQISVSQGRGERWDKAVSCRLPVQKC